MFNFDQVIFDLLWSCMTNVRRHRDGSEIDAQMIKSREIVKNSFVSDIHFDNRTNLGKIE